MFNNVEGTATKGLRNGLVFCLSFLLSAFGYEFLFFIMTVHVYDISKKAFSVGIFITLTFFPKIFSPFYGVLVDRYNRRTVMGINAGVVGVLVAVLGFVSDIYWIYGIWFITTIFIMLINNARTALMTDVMPADNYIWGNSVTLFFLNAAKLLGPLAAGLIMRILDKKILILFTSIVYFSCMLSSLLIKPGKSEKIELKSIMDTFTYVKEGIMYIWSSNIIKKLATLGLFWRLFLGMQFSLFIVYVTRYLRLTEVEYGFFMTATALGSLVGSFVSPFIVKRVNTYTLISIGLFLHFISFSILGVTKMYGLALVIVFTSYLIFYITVVGIHSIRDKSTKPNIRGRVYGSITSLLTPPTMISMLLCGFLADIYGVEKVFAASGIFAAISLVVIMLDLRASMKRGAQSEADI